MKKKRIIINYLFNLIYQVYVIIVPLITTPYVARILGPDGIGKYSFSQSRVNYFVLVAGFGFLTYGQREIAKHKDDIEKQSQVFWEIIISRGILVIFVSVVYLLFILAGAFGDYSDLMIAFSVNIIAVGFDICFYFSGNEEFGRLALRNIVLKTVGVVCIFSFVKKKEDLVLYVIINTLIILVSNISLWFYICKKIKIKKISFNRVLLRFREAIIFFIPAIATTIYTIFDKTLIGIMTPGTEDIIIFENGKYLSETVKRCDLENGYYEQAEKIIKLALTIITSLSTVIYSRNSAENEKGNKNEVKNNLYFSASLTWLLSLPMAFGAFSISSNLIPWFLGDGFQKSITLMRILAPLPIFIGFANVIGYQYLMASNREKIYTISVSIAAALNLIINLLLIPTLYSVGAAIGTIFAELSGPLICIIYLKKEIDVKKIFALSVKPLVASVVMSVFTFYLSLSINPSIYNTSIIVLVSVIIYGVALALLRESFIVMAIDKIMKRLKHLLH